MEEVFEFIVGQLQQEFKLLDYVQEANIHVQASDGHVIHISFDDEGKKET